MKKLVKVVALAEKIRLDSWSKDKKEYCLSIKQATEKAVKELHLGQEYLSPARKFWCYNWSYIQALNTASRD